MTDQPSASAAAQHISAASEERFIATTEELVRESSRATVVATITLQTLLVACVVLWVLDVPRMVFNLSFYTEQLLAVTLGLTLALAFTTETSRKHTPFDLAGAIASAVIVVYLIYSYRRDGGIAWPAVAGLAAALAWTFAAGRLAVAHWLDWVCTAASLGLCAYITVRYEALTYELAMLPLEGVIGSAILTFLVLEASRRISGWGFVGIILAIAVYVYISPFLAGDFQTRWVTPERMVAYVGLDVNGMIGSILQVAVLIVIPFTHPRPGAGAHRRRGLLRRPRNVGDVALPRRRGQDRGGRLCAVRHDLRQRGVERARGRRRHHPGDDASRASRPIAPPRSSRSARPAASSCRR